MTRAPTKHERELWHLADAARARSYTPYSHFTVGAALRSTDGEIVTGGNVENASYGMTICAERSAVVRAIAQGSRTFDFIAVAGPEGVADVPPCGACRQVLAEFGPGMDVMYPKGGELVVEPLADLLPGMFVLNPA